MFGKGTRIEISPDLHKTLKEVYQELQSQGIKGLTLKKVLEELCDAGLEFQELANQGVSGHTVSESGIKQPFNRSGEYVVETKSQLKLMQEAVIEKEKRILTREKHIDRREMIINDRYKSYFDDKDKLLSDRMRIDSKSAIEEKLNDKIKALEKTISDLKAEKRKIDKEVSSLLRRIDENTQTNILEKLLPLISPALSALVLNKISNINQDASPNPNPEQTTKLKPSTSEDVLTEQPSDKKFGKRGPYPPAPKPEKKNKTQSET